mmetsp:Transcript_35455/g.47916  ORF Transcript_35455/g.47916 Transcript_35455/m.47916 type:complete len:357 (+) Transcript_35455:537-1607(+)
MISDQILTGASHIHWIPVVEFITQFRQSLFRDLNSFSIIFAKHDVVPSINSQILSLDIERTSFASIKNATLKQVRYSVVSHIDGGIRKRFNNKLLIPRHTSTETLSSRATPFFKPVKNLLEFIQSFRVIGLEFVRLNMLHDKIFPVLFTIVKHPLVAASNDAFVTRARHNKTLRLVIKDSESIIDHLVLNNRLCCLNSHSLAISDIHNTFIETLKVDFFLGFSKLIRILVRLNLKFFNGFLSRKLTHTWSINNRDGLERYTPSFFNIEFLTEARLGLQITEHSKIIRRIRWNTGDNTSTLLHRDARQRQAVNLFVSSKRCLKSLTNEFRTLEINEARILCAFLSQILEGHVASSTL